MLVVFIGQLFIGPKYAIAAYRSYECVALSNLFEHAMHRIGVGVVDENIASLQAGPDDFVGGFECLDNRSTNFAASTKDNDLHSDRPL